jgi:hypothetical protein
MGAKMERRFLGLAANGDAVSVQVRNEIDWAATARMLDLADLLELIDEGVDERGYGVTAAQTGPGAAGACAYAVWC